MINKKYFFPEDKRIIIVGKNNAQTVNTGIQTKILLNQEYFNNYTYTFDNVNNQIILPEDGFYLITGYCGVVVNAAGSRGVGINNNGNFIYDFRPNPATTIIDGHRQTIIAYLAAMAGQTISLYYYQNSGANLALQISYTVPAMYPKLTIEFLQRL